MKRFYYISDDLDDLEQIEHDLEAGGIARPQIYLLSNDDVGLDNHDVNRVASFMKTDVIHSGEIGAVLGLAVAGVILLVAHFSGIAAQVGWVPFVFLAIIGCGFVVTQVDIWTRVPDQATAIPTLAGSFCIDQDKILSIGQISHVHLVSLGPSIHAAAVKVEHHRDGRVGVIAGGNMRTIGSCQSVIFQRFQIRI